MMSRRLDSWDRIWHRELVRNSALLLLVFLLALPASLPLLQFKQMSGHDAYAYPPAVVEFAQGLREGQLFSRWAPNLGGGYGIPLFNFRPPLFYGLASLFHLSGASSITSVNLAILVLLIGSGLTMCLFVQEFFGTLAGVVAAGAYMYAPYFLYDLYVRHALSEFSAFPLIPLGFWSLYRYCKEARYHQLLISSGAVALLFLSSNPIALILFPWLILYYLVLVWRNQRVTYALRGAVPLVLGCGLSCFFWLPALQEIDLVHLSRVVTGYFTYSNHFLLPHQLLYAPWGYGSFLPRPKYGTSLQVGPLHLLAVLIGVYSIRGLIKRRDDASITILLFIAMFILSAFLTSTLSQFLWRRIPLLDFVQFPWRYLALTSAASSVLMGYMVARLAGRSLKSLAGAGVITLVLLLLAVTHARPESFYEVDEATYLPANIARNNLQVDASREHVPIWVEEQPSNPVSAKLCIIQGYGRVTTLSLASTHQRFRVWIEKEVARLRANTFYFPEWRIFVDGELQEITITKPEGLMEFSVEAGEHQIEIVFHNSAVRNYGTSLSFVSLGLLVLYELSALWADPDRQSPASYPHTADRR